MTTTGHRTEEEEGFRVLGGEYKAQIESSVGGVIKYLIACC